MPIYQFNSVTYFIISYIFQTSEGQFQNTVIFVIFGLVVRERAKE